MIYLFACGSKGIAPELDHDVDYQNLYRLANSQGVWQTVFLSVKKNYANKKTGLNETTFKKLQGMFLSKIATETNRRSYIFQTIAHLESHDISCCLLKGDAVALAYDTPSARISSDTDIFIGKENEEKAIILMKELGYCVVDRVKTSHHLVCTHAVAGTVELHLFLYDELFEDVWFDHRIDLKEKYMEITSEEGFTFHTLGINDGFVFVVLHFIKHFLSQGAGIRQLMDVLLYAQHYKAQIDMVQFSKLMTYLKFDKFFDVSMSIGVDFLLFHKEEALFIHGYDNDASMHEELLGDMEDGGVFGQNDSLRYDFYRKYNEERFHTFKKDDYKSYMKEWSKQNKLQLIFLPRKRLAQKYPYVLKFPLLVPVAWTHRFILLLYALFVKEKKLKTFVTYTVPEENESVKQRMDLIRKLDMI
jgi:hypothetical protein